MDVITDTTLWELVKHLKQWLLNLRRANAKRKAQSVQALRTVIIAARQTSAYVRQVKEAGRVSHDTEGKLAAEWTRLGFELQDLGLTKLAKRCDINGRYWANPAQFDDAYLHKADIGLERMELLARQMVAEVER
ncbi:hypothetical protein [Alteromonas sp. CYL-A6]|uniref:hypothetical protein n=1 Tax=Alteromonas nitratireducens TaxID=3390813 RepID=UPI0034B2DAD2